jgi:hypothetical protein
LLTGKSSAGAIWGGTNASEEESKEENAECGRSHLLLPRHFCLKEKNLAAARPERK